MTTDDRYAMKALKEAAARQPDGGAAALKDGTDWNPRYVCYAAMNGRTPEAQLEHDKATYPGGCMTGFIAAIGELWAKWDRDHGHKADHHRDAAEHEAFTAWLWQLAAKVVTL